MITVPVASTGVYPLATMVLSTINPDLAFVGCNGVDPRRGVTGSFGEFHGVPGLIVADASLFPGPIGINPMETVIALALRNARRLLERRAAHGI